VFFFVKKYFLEGYTDEDSIFQMQASQAANCGRSVQMLVVLALMLCTALTARAQNTSASLRGTVTDVQGADRSCLVTSP